MNLIGALVEIFFVCFAFIMLYAFTDKITPPEKVPGNSFGRPNLSVKAPQPFLLEYRFRTFPRSKCLAAAVSSTRSS